MFASIKRKVGDVARFNIEHTFSNIDSNNIGDFGSAYLSRGYWPNLITLNLS